MKAKIEAAASKMRDAAAKEAYQFSEDVMAQSKEVCPEDTGALLGTGHVQLPEIEGSKITVTMGYGGPSAPYAAAVHENLDPHVHWKRPGSGPKYLENPLTEKTPEFPDRIRGAIKDAIGG